MARRTAIAIAAVGVVAAAGYCYGTRAPTAASDLSVPTGAAAGGPIAEVALPAELSANAQLGKTIFEAVCASCHGLNAAGQEGVAPPLVHRIYEPSHHADFAFVMAARNGVQAHHWRFGNMPPVQERLTDAEIASIVRYIRELQRENGIF